MSDYFRELPKVAKRRYEEKLASIGVENIEKFDPFEQSDAWIDDVTKWPQVEFGQIYVYLIESPGPFTRETMKAYKSLEAFNQFQSGWVQTCLYMELNRNVCLLKAKVTRSQAVTEKPHEVWCALEKGDAAVLAAHCTCMAGLGEMCSHVAAVLFKMEACTRLGFNKVSCTSIPCAWNQTFTKKVEAARIEDISFQKPKHKTFHKATPPPDATVNKTQFADTSSFLEKLRKSNKKAVIFSITDPKPQPDLQEPSYPMQLSSIYSIENVTLSGEELKTKCDEVLPTIIVTEQQSAKIEETTRQQNKCAGWFMYRRGRLTSSNFYDISHTNNIKCKNPSLLGRIMQYAAQPSSAAISWGLANEKSALDQYKLVMEREHKNFKIRRSGLIINPEYPFLATSPDAMTTCDCCGSGCVEVKCPFTFKESTPCQVDDSKFCLNSHMPSDICLAGLKTDHKYYYQVQGQIHLASVKFCDFVCWTVKGIHIQRIGPDAKFFSEMFEKLEKYFLNIALPELLTNKLKTERESQKSLTSFCFCGKDESFDTMIACDSVNCAKEWYHLSCVGLKKAPPGQWLCLACKNCGRKKKK